MFRLIYFPIIWLILLNFISALHVKNVTHQRFSNSRGQPYCYMDTPLMESRVRSLVECSTFCFRFKNITKVASCNLFNYNKSSDGGGSVCQMFNVKVLDNLLMASVNGCSAYGVKELISISECDFPYTYDGQLYYSCAKLIPNANGSYYCLTGHRNLTICKDPFVYNATNTTISITVPTFSTSVDVTSVNGWIVIQQRIDGSQSFSQDWNTYKAGFGVYNQNFWLGLEKIYQLTNSATYKVRFEVFAGGIWFSDEYDKFWLDNESTSYTLHVTGYSGDNLDVLKQQTIHGFTTLQDGMKFSTQDKDNTQCGCPAKDMSGYWHNCCYAQNLNGFYGQGNMGYFMQKYNSWMDIVHCRMMIKLA